MDLRRMQEIDIYIVKKEFKSKTANLDAKLVYVLQFTLCLFKYLNIYCVCLEDTWSKKSNKQSRPRAVLVTRGGGWSKISLETHPGNSQLSAPVS